MAILNSDTFWQLKCVTKSIERCALDGHMISFGCDFFFEIINAKDYMRSLMLSTGCGGWSTNIRGQRTFTTS